MFSIQRREQSDTYEVVPVHDMQAFRGVEVQFHTFLGSALQYMDMSSLLQSQVLPVPLKTRLSVNQSWDGHFGVDKVSSPARNQTIPQLTNL